MNYYHAILQWFEVWAVIIPLLVYFYRKPNGLCIRPIFWYLVVALILNIISDIIRDNYYVIRDSNSSVPMFIKAINYNLALYNIHSIIRLFLFIDFFHSVNVPQRIRLKKIMPFLIGIIVFINFIFFNKFTDFSSNVFTFESVILIIYCINYFLTTLRNDEVSTKFDSSLIIAIGIAVYEAVCFPIFLFYDLLIKKFEGYAIDIWDVHNTMYTILCLFIARAFYGRVKT